MCQCPLDLTGFIEQMNERVRWVNPQPSDCRATFQRTRVGARESFSVWVLLGRVCRELSPDVMHQESPSWSSVPFKADDFELLRVSVHVDVWAVYACREKGRLGFFYI